MVSKILLVLVFVGMCAGSNAQFIAPTPYGMSNGERQRIENEEMVRAYARRNAEDRIQMEKNIRDNLLETLHAATPRLDEPSNWGRMPGESQTDEQAEALCALMLLGALCEQAKKEQEQQEALKHQKETAKKEREQQEEMERQKEMVKQEGRQQPNVSGRQADTPPEHEDEESTGAGVWLVLVLLGGAGVYVIYGELKHRSGSRGKPLPRLRRPNIVCPHCGCVYEYDPELIGVTVQCGSCNQEFVAQKPN